MFDPYDRLRTISSDVTPFAQQRQTSLYCKPERHRSQTVQNDEEDQFHIQSALFHKKLDDKSDIRC